MSGELYRKWCAPYAFWTVVVVGVSVSTEEIVAVAVHDHAHDHAAFSRAQGRDQSW
jgi:hypothetical protein